MVIDIHTHTTPNVDDGSESMETSLQMLRSMADQGCNRVFATPHSDAFDFGSHEHTYQQIRSLQHNAAYSGIPVHIYPGCEIHNTPARMDEILENLRDHIYPSLNGSKYILSEFSTTSGNLEDALYCLKRYINNGWIPIIAHAERYYSTFSSISNIKRLKELGCLVQINYYSLAEEQDNIIRHYAQDLLLEELVDFVGSDAHRMDHRKPAIEKGHDYILKNCREKYADRILWKNAEEMLL